MMNLAIAIPVLFSIGSAYLILQDEDIKESTFFVSKRRARVASFFPKIFDHGSVLFRLSEIGKSNVQDLNKFRFEQFAFMFALSFSTYIFLSILGKSHLLVLIMAISTGLAGYFMLDRALTKKILKNRTQLESEFPAVIEMLTLCMAAGETPLGAMARVSQRSTGLLSAEFAMVIQSVTSGTPFQFALDEMGRRIKSTHIRRFVDALITAMLRGAPLVDVLQSHARNAREAERNRVLSAAGKSEVSMMIPVVFLILPISILFALWPSLSNLNLFLA
ncbi:MAG: type II secretion system F family protein [Candidatus Planktophila sp.]